MKSQKHCSTSNGCITDYSSSQACGLKREGREDDRTRGPPVSLQMAVMLMEDDYSSYTSQSNVARWPRSNFGSSFSMYYFLFLTSSRLACLTSLAVCIF